VPSGRLRFCFADAKFAKAFVVQHGGRHVPVDEAAAALATDADDDALYDRLTADYNE